MRPVKALDGSGAHTGKVTWCISAMRLAGGTKTRTTRDRVGVFVPGRHRRAYHSQTSDDTQWPLLKTRRGAAIAKADTDVRALSLARRKRLTMHR